MFFQLALTLGRRDCCHFCSYYVESVDFRTSQRLEQVDISLVSGLINMSYWVLGLFLVYAAASLYFLSLSPAFYSAWSVVGLYATSTFAISVFSLLLTSLYIMKKIYLVIVPQFCCCDGLNLFLVRLIMDLLEQHSRF